MFLCCFSKRGGIVRIKLQNHSYSSPFFYGEIVNRILVMWEGENEKKKPRLQRLNVSA